MLARVAECKDRQLALMSKLGHGRSRRVMNRIQYSLSPERQRQREKEALEFAAKVAAGFAAQRFPSLLQSAENERRIAENNR